MLLDMQSFAGASSRARCVFDAELIPMSHGLDRVYVRMCVFLGACAHPYELSLIAGMSKCVCESVSTVFYGLFVS